ncbi:MAG: response regulator [Dehalococcoidales bacterium]|nr:response regulator [Dehalococcoidales bacterium]
MAKKRILVLSQDPGLIGSLKANFPGRSYKMVLIEKDDGRLKENLEALQPDVVLIDILAPGVEGVQTMLEVRQLSPAPILGLCKSREHRDRVRRLDLKSDNYLSEPLTFTDLMKQIEAITSPATTG